MSKFLSVSDIFSEFLFEIGKFRLKKASKNSETKPEAYFSKKLPNLWSKVSSMTQICEKHKFQDF